MAFNIKNFMATRGLIGGLFDDSADQGMKQLKDSVAIRDGIKVPDLTWDEYRPELYGSPEEIQAQLISENPELLSRQGTSLNMLQQLAEQGLSAEDELGFARARDLGAQQARAGTGAALADAAARGVSGGGLEFAMREMANQGGAQRSQSAGLEQAAAAARQRALASQAYNQAIGAQRGQDYTVNNANTDIINRFNQANTQNRNMVQQHNVDTRNNAQQYNSEGKRGVQQQNFDNQVTKSNGQVQARQGLATGYAAQNAANEAARNQDFKNFMSIMSMVGSGGAGGAPGGGK